MTKRKKEVAQKKHERENDKQKDSAVRDQSEKKYYYDDAHGYEVYNPEKDEETNENQ